MSRFSTQKGRSRRFPSEDSAERPFFIQNAAELAEASDLDAVLIPNVEAIQYSIPLHTNIKVYEIWMRYRFKLLRPGEVVVTEQETISFNQSQAFAEWTLAAYGKTPTAFMQADTDAVNLAAVMALRDAGANFALSFPRVPTISGWLNTSGPSL